MAYISAAEVKVIRDNLKAAFPAKDGWKFSVRGDNHTAVRVAIMAFPKGYDFPGHAQVNHYHIDTSGYGDKEKEVLKKVSAIVHEKHWDKSDIMTDYFNCAFYVTIEIGKWDKEAVAVEPKAKKVRKSRGERVAAHIAETQEKYAPRHNPKKVGYGLSDSECRDIAAFVGIHF